MRDHWRNHGGHWRDDGGHWRDDGDRWRDDGGHSRYDCGLTATTALDNSFRWHSKNNEGGREISFCLGHRDFRFLPQSFEDFSSASVFRGLLSLPRSFEDFLVCLDQLRASRCLGHWRTSRLPQSLEDFMVCPSHLRTSCSFLPLRFASGER